MRQHESAAPARHQAAAGGAIPGRANQGNFAGNTSGTARQPPRRRSGRGETTRRAAARSGAAPHGAPPWQRAPPSAAAGGACRAPPTRGCVAVHRLPAQRGRARDGRARRTTGDDSGVPFSPGGGLRRSRPAFTLPLRGRAKRDGRGPTTAMRRSARFHPSRSVPGKILGLAQPGSH
jgi:hypothetical protein